MNITQWNQQDGQRCLSLLFPFNNSNLTPTYRLKHPVGPVRSRQEMVSSDAVQECGNLFWGDAPTPPAAWRTGLPAAGPEAPPCLGPCPQPLSALIPSPAPGVRGARGVCSPTCHVIGTQASFATVDPELALDPRAELVAPGEHWFSKTPTCKRDYEHLGDQQRR